MPDELLRRAVDVLVRLRTLSEVPAHAYDREQTSHTADDELPVRFTAAGDLVPVEPSEFLYWRGRINESHTREGLEIAVIGAEEAHRSIRNRLHVPSERMRPAEMRDQVVTWHHAGLTDAEIAYKGDLKVRWVQWVVRNAPPRPEDNT